MLYSFFEMLSVPFWLTFFFGCLIGSLARRWAVCLLNAESVACSLSSGRLFLPFLSGTLCCIVLKQFGCSISALRGILLLGILLTITLTDCYSFLIPNLLPAAGCLLFIAAACLEQKTVSYFLNALMMSSLLAGGMLLFSQFFDWITGKESLGGGDIKLFFMTGLYLSSVWELLFFLLLSSLFGIVLSLIRRENRIPFGPAISAASFLLLLYGDAITQWYTSLF